MGLIRSFALLSCLVIVVAVSSTKACTNSWTLFKDRSSLADSKYLRLQEGNYTEEGCKLECAKRYGCARVEYNHNNKTCWTSTRGPSQVEVPGVNTWELYRANCPSCYTSFSYESNVTTKSEALKKVDIWHSNSYYCREACSTTFGCKTANYFDEECWLGFDAEAETEVKIDATRYVLRRDDPCGDGCAVFTWQVYQNAKSTSLERRIYEEGSRVSLSNCQRACELTVNCVAIQYDRDGTRCSFFTRSQVTALVPSVYVTYYEVYRHGCNEWSSSDKAQTNDGESTPDVDETGPSVVDNKTESDSGKQAPCQVLTSQTNNKDNYMISIFLGVNAKPESK